MAVAREHDRSQATALAELRFHTGGAVAHSPDNMTSGGPLDPTLTLGGDPNGRYWKAREADKTVNSNGWFWNTGERKAYLGCISRLHDTMLTDGARRRDA